MKVIKNVAILGAGAMGAYFASQFLKTPGYHVCFLAEGERQKKLTNGGFRVNGESFSVPVSDFSSPEEPIDLLIVALKHHHLMQISTQLKSIVSEKTIVISVMNGLDSEQIIAEKSGSTNVLYAVSVGIDAVRSGNEIVYSKPGIHYFGEANNAIISDRVQAVQNAFSDAQIGFETPVDMLRMMWWKFMINVGMNPSSAVMRAPYGVFQSYSQALDLMKSLMNEVIQLAQAEQVNLSGKDLDDWIAVLRTLSPTGKTSMLQDKENGVKTEIDVFCQKAVDLGKKHGVATPVNQTILQIVRVLEANT